MAQSLDVDKAFFDQLSEQVDHIKSILSDWQKKDGALSKLAENHAKASGAEGADFHAKVYAHKKMIKEAMANHAKQNMPETSGAPPMGMPPPMMGGGPPPMDLGAGGPPSMPPPMGLPPGQMPPPLG